MPTVWFIGDTHFGHSSTVLKYKRPDGTPLRDFPCVDAMNEHMITCWNSVVKPKDRVYHLGDVVINRKCLQLLDRLNGRKVLIKGNHDIFELDDYAAYFDDIRAYRVFVEHRIIASHIPIHPQSLERWNANVHGHLHANNIMLNGLTNTPDPRYINVSVEQINYTPVSYDSILERMAL